MGLKLTNVGLKFKLNMTVQNVLLVNFKINQTVLNALDKKAPNKAGLDCAKS